MRYRAQYNFFYIILSGVLLILVVVDCWIGQSVGIIVTILLAILLWISLLREYYIIERRTLWIKRGLVNLSVPVDEIHRLNVVEVRERTGVEVIMTDRIVTVYPVDIMQFVEHLRWINPDIEIENSNMTKETVTVR